MHNRREIKKTQQSTMNVEENEKINVRKSFMIWRYYVAALGLLANLLASSFKMALAISLVNMTNSTTMTRGNHSTIWTNMTTTSCLAIYNSTHDTSKSRIGGEFNWSPELQGFILAAGMIGYIIIPIVGGKLADTYGAKWIVLWGNSLGALGMLVSPIASSWHPYVLIVAQTVRGIGQGLIIPAVYPMLTNWTPRSERSFISTINFVGVPMGFVIGGVLAGFLCGTPYLGWRAVFYFFGGIGVLYSILHSFTFYETPEDHPWISEAERKYIIQDRGSDKNENKKPPIPWLKMLTSVRMYALIYTLFTQRWAISHFASAHPAYLGNVLHYPIAKNGLISSMPFLMSVFGSLCASAVADWLYRQNCVGIDKLRKGVNFLGCFGFLLSMLGIYFAGCVGSLNVVFLTTSLFSVGVAVTGSSTSIVDMAPNFAATVAGITSLISNQSSLVVPIVVGFLTKHQTMEEWQSVFIINMAVGMSSGIIFVVFGSAEPQPWNFVEDGSLVEFKMDQAKGSSDHAITEDDRKRNGISEDVK